MRLAVPDEQTLMQDVYSPIRAAKDINPDSQKQVKRFQHLYAMSKQKDAKRLELYQKYNPDLTVDY